MTGAFSESLVGGSGDFREFAVKGYDFNDRGKSIEACGGKFVLPSIIDDVRFEQGWRGNEQVPGIHLSQDFLVTGLLITEGDQGRGVNDQAGNPFSSYRKSAAREECTSRPLPEPTRALRAA